MQEALSIAANSGHITRLCLTSVPIPLRQSSAAVGAERPRRISSPDPTPSNCTSFPSDPT